MHKSSQKRIGFFFLSKDVTVRNRIKLKKFIGQMISDEGYTLGTINYIFCSDAYLLSMNRRYLKHDYYTDIITFDMSPNSIQLDAEIYISGERVKDNAKGLKVLLSEELLRVMFHGILHLCGYSDKGKRQKIKMRRREDHYLAKYKKYVPREKMF